MKPRWLIAAAAAALSGVAAAGLWRARSGRPVMPWQRENTLECMGFTLDWSEPENPTVDECGRPLAASRAHVVIEELEDGLESSIRTGAFDQDSGKPKVGTVLINGRRMAGGTALSRDYCPAHCPGNCNRPEAHASRYAKNAPAQ